MDDKERFGISAYDMPLWKDGPTEREIQRERNKWADEFLKRTMKDLKPGFLLPKEERPSGWIYEKAAPPPDFYFVPVAYPRHHSKWKHWLFLALLGLSACYNPGYQPNPLWYFQSPAYQGALYRNQMFLNQNAQQNQWLASRIDRGY